MGVLSRFERRLGGAVEGGFTKIFRSRVEPVELAVALKRECDDERAIGGLNTLVPNDFTIDLGPSDYDRLAPYILTLADELGDMVREHANEQRYTFVGPVAVAFVRDERLSTGSYRVASRVEAADEPPPAPPVPQAGTFQPEALRTQAIPRPARQQAARLELPDGSSHSLPAGETVLGRGQDADVRLADASVSRRHATVTVTASGGAQVADLDSTNGTSVNGKRVRTATLSDGDTLTLGSATIVFRS